MFRPWETFVGTRYLRSRTRSRFVSFISLISVVGIAVAVAVLIVVLAVMNGFEHEVRQRILSVVAHATVTGFDGRLDDWRILQGIAERDERVTASAPFVRGQAMLAGTSGIAGVELRGIRPDAEAATSGAARLMTSGRLDSLQPQGWRIVLGEELARRLGVTVGDRLILMSPGGAVTPAGLLPRMRRFEVSGLFAAGMYEFDRSLAYVHLEDAARLFRLGDAVTGVSLAVREPLAAARIVRDVAVEFGGGVYVGDWTRRHANFFRSIELTKSIIFFILLMVVAVAAFNIVSTLVMVVREKASEIAILRSMGASARSVLWVFVSQGTCIGAVGTLLGAAAGVGLALNISELAGLLERLLGISFVAPDVYFIGELPSRLVWADVARVCAVAFALAVLATVYPALRGAATRPAEALRHD